LWGQWVLHPGALDQRRRRWASRISQGTLSRCIII
jgi:hypothetical protein